MGAGIPRRDPRACSTASRTHQPAALGSRSKARRRRARRDHAARPRGATGRGPAGAPDAPAVPAIIALNLAGHHARAQGERPGRRLRRSRARPPAATTRRRAARAAQRARRAGLRRARRGGPREGPRARRCRSGWPAGTGSPAASPRRSTAGAAGIQVGTLFAFCEESGLAAGVQARRCWRSACRGRGGRVHGSRAPRRRAIRSRWCTGPASPPDAAHAARAGLRPGLPAHALRERPDGKIGLPLRRRAGARVPEEGRRDWRTPWAASASATP